MPLWFFRELIFESKEEYDINSTAFNTKKVMTFMIIVLSIILNTVVIWRILTLALDNIELKEKIVVLENSLDYEKMRASTKPDTKPTRSSK